MADSSCSRTLGILLLGVIAFGIGTAAGVLTAKLMNPCSKNKINPAYRLAGRRCRWRHAYRTRWARIRPAELPADARAMGPNVAGDWLGDSRRDAQVRAGDKSRYPSGLPDCIPVARTDAQHRLRNVP
ncbi:sodium ion-translocating decarboxylase subunit beta [Salmonella enterica subsp. enterica]|nr:sodium ion-translocating decarboxylase subunit beta [Salmonella enterica subsp. enterica]